MEQALSDPDRFVWQQLMPALAAHGYSTTDTQVQELFRLFHDRTALDVMTKLLTQEESYKAHALQFELASGTAGATQLSDDVTVALHSLSTQLWNFAAVLTSPIMKDAAHALSWLAQRVGDFSQALAAFDKDHPLAAKALGWGALGAGGAVGGYLSWKLLSGFGRLMFGAAATEAEVAVLGTASATAAAEVGLLGSASSAAAWLIARIPAVLAAYEAADLLLHGFAPPANADEPAKGFHPYTEPPHLKMGGRDPTPAEIAAVRIARDIEAETIRHRGFFGLPPVPLHFPPRADGGGDWLGAAAKWLAEALIPAAHAAYEEEMRRGRSGSGLGLRGFRDLLLEEDREAMRAHELGRLHPDQPAAHSPFGAIDFSAFAKPQKVELDPNSKATVDVTVTMRVEPSSELFRLIADAQAQAKASGNLDAKAPTGVSTPTGRMGHY